MLLLIDCPQKVMCFLGAMGSSEARRRTPEEHRLLVPAGAIYRDDVLRSKEEVVQIAAGPCRQTYVVYQHKSSKLETGKSLGTMLAGKLVNMFQDGLHLFSEPLLMLA